MTSSRPGAIPVKLESFSSESASPFGGFSGDMQEGGRHNGLPPLMVEPMSAEFGGGSAGDMSDGEEDMFGDSYTMAGGGGGGSPVSPVGFPKTPRTPATPLTPYTPATAEAAPAARPRAAAAGAASAAAQAAYSSAVSTALRSEPRNRLFARRMREVQASMRQARDMKRHEEDAASVLARMTRVLDTAEADASVSAKNLHQLRADAKKMHEWVKSHSAHIGEIVTSTTHALYAMCDAAREFPGLRDRADLLVPDAPLDPRAAATVDVAQIKQDPTRLCGSLQVSRDRFVIVSPFGNDRRLLEIKNITRGGYRKMMRPRTAPASSGPSAAAAAPAPASRPSRPAPKRGAAAPAAPAPPKNKVSGGVKKERRVYKRPTSMQRRAADKGSAKSGD